MEDTQKSSIYPNEFNWCELPDPCGRCHQPYHLAQGQEFPFCPNCAADQINARRGREALTVAKARDLRRRIDAAKVCAPRGPFVVAMSGLILALLLWPAAVGAICGDYTYCNSALDPYVTENLIRLSDAAKEAREDAFWKNLRCYDRSDDKYGRVSCDVDGKEIVWEDERQDFYNPDPAVIFVAADGLVQFGKLDTVAR